MSLFPKGVSEMAKRKRYDREFKLGAARLVVEQGYTRAEAARRLGISAWSIGRWIEHFRASGELPPEGEPVPEAEEMKGLRKEVKRLRLENEILKKAAAYFAKESL
jgi:transposase-like protein